jgi:hypothetical protein
VTTNLRHTRGIVFAALLALSLWLSAMQAVADTRPSGSPNLFDPGFMDNRGFLPRPIGHLGVTWE